jgi:hypothetical protein
MHANRSEIELFAVIATDNRLKPERENSRTVCGEIV